MPRVLICDELGQAGIELLVKARLEVDNRPGLKGDALSDAIRGADGAIVRSGTRITGALLENPGKLRAIARAGAGVDNIDVAAATRKGIVVMNTPGGNTVSAAEHTIALMFSMARHVAAADASVRTGKWERTRFIGTQLTGKILGVIGLGKIGCEVARRAIGLDMKVYCFDPFITPERAAQLGVEAASSIDDLLPRCDFLTIHTPLNDQTKSLIGKRELSMMKNSARVLNVARGGIIDEQALCEALREGVIKGAAIDVFSQEPIAPENPLLNCPNIVLTPHLGASTVEAQETVSLEASQLLIDYLTRGAVRFAVNMPPLDRTELEELKPYIDLARRLGLLHAQMASKSGPIRRAELTYKGDLGSRPTRLLNAAFAAGLLEGHLDEQVNIVNAELLAKERGIEIIATSMTTKGDFANVLQADVVTDKKTYTAAGTLFGNQMLRLVQLGPFRLDSFIDGILMIFTHRDQPGIIGHVGTIFGKHRVNIAQMTVGRELRVPGGDAVGVLNLDNMPPKEALDEVTSNAHISSISIVKLPPQGELPSWLG
jgi:D-3-phosphoglycerate dehydrogenase